jgi:hypothetical protein
MCRCCWVSECAGCAVSKQVRSKYENSLFDREQAGDGKRAADVLCQNLPSFDYMLQSG